MSAAPMPAARYALTVIAAAVIITGVLVAVTHLLGQPSP